MDSILSDSTPSQLLAHRHAHSQTHTQSQQIILPYLYVLLLNSYFSFQSLAQNLILWDNLLVQLRQFETNHLLLLLTLFYLPH